MQWFLYSQSFILSSQSFGGAKTGDPWEKTLDHMQAELGLSHMWPELGSNPQRWDDERFYLRRNKISSWESITFIKNNLFYSTKLWSYGLP